MKEKGGSTNMKQNALKKVRIRESRGKKKKERDSETKTNDIRAEGIGATEV